MVTRTQECPHCRQEIPLTDPDQNNQAANVAVVAAAQIII